ncbi:MAG: CBS domain-containing protein [Nitriliruptorales bacterium]
MTVRPTTSLRAAAEIMTNELISMVLVEGQEGARGVLSERDIVRALAEGADPDDDRAIDFATTDIASIADDASIEEAAVAMEEASIRHLVVLRDGEIAGVISMRDLVAASVEEIRSRG